MSDTPSAMQPDPSVIGGVPKAKFARKPDPDSVFSRRAARFGTLAAESDLAPYLQFLGAITAAQAAILPGLPPVDALDPDAVDRARQFRMPPLDRVGFKIGPVLDATFTALFDACAQIAQPEAAAAALGRVRALSESERQTIVTDVLTDAIAPERLADYVYVAAGLQVHFSRLAAELDDASLVAIEVGLCPACGSRPVSSVIAGAYGIEGVRYATCMLCATQWNEVRVKCLSCGSTKGVGYQEIEGSTHAIKAETCDECESYVKVLYQDKEPALDPVADDVGSLALDVLLRTAGKYRRAAINPYLAGY